jgi:hypothetical protein
MVLVGIDFSLNSPAFCIYNEGVYHWGSLTRSERTADSLMKNTKKPYSILGENENFTLIFMEKKDLPEDYLEKERLKIDFFLEVVDTLFNSISDKIGHKDFYVAMEGLSFSSNGNSLIDISMATALLRERIVQKIGKERFYVFSPSSIKKFAKKGNSKKDELYEALIEKKEETNLTEFTNILEKNKHEWITKSKQVNKPIDDIVDATWITLFLKEKIKE